MPLASRECIVGATSSNYIIFGMVFNKSLSHITLLNMIMTSGGISFPISLEDRLIPLAAHTCENLHTGDYIEATVTNDLVNLLTIKKWEPTQLDRVLWI